MRTTVTALVLGLLTHGGVAASPICDQLGFSLATLPDRGEDTVDIRKYARAIARQQQSLRDLTVTIGRTGCSQGSVLVVGGPNAEVCTQLLGKKTRMQRNLDILVAKKASLTAARDSGKTREAVLSELDRNGCRSESEPTDRTVADNSAAPALGPDGVVETIRVPQTEPDYTGSRFVDLGGAARNGSFQTMCVRTCDGAYFPVSSHASPLNFRRDAQVCSMMCPGTETDLYYHPLTSESAEMRSATTGQHYEDLATAFHFRLNRQGNRAECGCNFALYYQEMLRRQAYIDNPGSLSKPSEAIVWVKPKLRPSLESQIAETSSAERAENARISRIPMFVSSDLAFLPEERIDFTRSTDTASQ